MKQTKKSKNHLILFTLFLTLLFSSFASAEGVTLSVDSTKLEIPAGETFTLTFTVNNSFINTLPVGKTNSIEQFDLYLLDLNDSWLSVESINPTDWTRQSILAYGDERFNHENFNDGKITITFKVNEKAIPGTYFLRGYYSYFGDDQTVGLNPNELGEAISPTNDLENKIYAQLIIKPANSNPLSFLSNRSPTDWLFFGIIIVALIIIGVGLLSLQWRLNRTNRFK